MILANIATFISASIAPVPTAALETGQCFPAAQVRAALAAEGMNPIIVGNRSGYGFPTSLIFFATADGSRGYLVRGDKPLGGQATIACIDSVYRDIRLHDVSTPDIPAWAKFGGSAAASECAREKLGFQEICADADKVTTELNQNGQRVMLEATGDAINPRDKSIRHDQRIVVTLRGSDRIGLVRAVTSGGAGYVLAGYSSGSYTQFGDNMLRSR